MGRDNQAHTSVSSNWKRLALKSHSFWKQAMRFCIRIEEQLQSKMAIYNLLRKSLRMELHFHLFVSYCEAIFFAKGASYSFYQVIIHVVLALGIVGRDHFQQIEDKMIAAIILVFQLYLELRNWDFVPTITRVRTI
ncbi:hypothetical protein TorRG33x02_148710 [Trema orientale]|uniref:Uncharacterized protein n=1 Tax=Trema orientale TaxID=63057 RepID=A0A2P5EUX0_TREOI|nr:hypothetical protein TorRG33x02_148710 [Trema orientale]